MTKIILGLGSNLGNGEENLRSAIKLIAAELLNNIIESSIYKSAPLLPENPESGWEKLEFSNMVIAGELKQPINPLEFLAKIKEFERQIGRKPASRWAPRVIDIDILAWGREIINLPDLRIPHPEMVNRDFVMQPLLEILPNWRHP